MSGKENNMPHKPGRIVYVLIMVTLIQTLYPITGDGSTLTLVIFQSFYLLLIIAGIFVARDSPRNLRILIGLGLLWILSGIAFALNPTETLTQLAAYISIGVYQGAIAIILLQYVFQTRQVSRDVLYAASAVYLLIGAVFVAIYGSIETLTIAQTGLHAFSDGLVAKGEFFPWQNFVYFSYTTLTTLGYGDIQPVTMWARSFATLEAIIGVLYTTVIIARLVGLYASGEIEQSD